MFIIKFMHISFCIYISICTYVKLLKLSNDIEQKFVLFLTVFKTKSFTDLYYIFIIRNVFGNLFLSMGKKEGYS